MEILFAALSLLLIFIGIRTHKKINAVAGIVFISMLLISILAENLVNGFHLAVKENTAVGSEEIETESEDEGQMPADGAGGSGSLETPAEGMQESEGSGGIYNMEDYGTVKRKRHDTYGESGELLYYYEMENFYFNDTVPGVINDALQQIYDEYEAQYIETAELIKSGDKEFDEPVQDTPNDHWKMLKLSYVGEDYVSIVYDDASDMSGVRPYSRYDGITIDCKSGKQVSAPKILGKSDRAVLKDVSGKMGLDDIASWDDVDFYLTDTAAVFFYRVPDWWEDVALPRKAGG